MNLHVVVIKGIGALGGALAITGGCPVRTRQRATALRARCRRTRVEAQPFYGQHQAGVLTPQQASMMLVAFDVLASDKADLERLFRLLTQRIAFLTKGGRRRTRQIRVCRRWIPASSAVDLPG
jgi:deferrochelatase/peroxidase EfeB